MAFTKSHTGLIKIFVDNKQVAAGNSALGFGACESTLEVYTHFLFFYFFYFFGERSLNIYMCVCVLYVCVRVVYVCVCVCVCVCTRAPLPCEP